MDGRRLELTARQRRAVGMFTVAALLVAVAAFYWLKPPVVAPPAESARGPVAVEAWRFTGTGSGWVALRGYDPGGGRSTLLATHDGGRTWTRLAPLGISGYVTWLEVFDAGHGLVQVIRDESDARASLLATDDGGRTWRELRREPRARPWFLDPLHGWLLADSLSRTVDGGRTWSALAGAGLPRSGTLGPISFVTVERGFLVHATPTFGVDLYATGDGGQSWQRLDLPPAAGMPAAAEFDEVRTLGAGAAFAGIRADRPAGAAAGWVYRSLETGAGWDVRALPGARASGDVSVALVGPGQWWMAQGRQLWVTGDAGVDWVPRPAQLPGRAVLGRLQAVNGLEAWSVGRMNAEAGAGALLLRTVDGGRHWTAIDLPRPV